MLLIIIYPEGLLTWGQNYIDDYNDDDDDDDEESEEGEDDDDVATD